MGPLAEDCGIYDIFKINPGKQMGCKPFILRGESSVIISGTGACGTGNNKLLVCKYVTLPYYSLRIENWAALKPKLLNKRYFTI